MKTNEEIVDEFRKQFPPFKGVGARFPMFAETPVYTHVIQFIERALEAKDKECEERVMLEIACLSESLLPQIEMLTKKTRDNELLAEVEKMIETLTAVTTPTKTDKREQL